jgi:Transcriptional regulators
METLSRLPQESTREYVFRSLKQNMMNFKLAPGTAMSEQEVADLLKVSRTPVREAFIRLSQEGLLDIVPQKGTYVSYIDLESVEESKFLRETLETAIMEIACKSFPDEQLFELQSNVILQELCYKEKNSARFYELDEALHRLIFEGCKKARIWATMQQLHAHYNRVRMLNVAGGHEVFVLLEQHKMLVQAIREKNVALGIKTIKQHLNKVRFDLKDLLEDYPEYFRQPRNP